MHEPLPDRDLVVATPERVSFDYRIAGLGTRAIAQCLDLLILAGVLIALLFTAAGIGVTTGNATIANLLFALAAFALVFGYFWLSEAIWSGQTVGKKVFRLRAIGDRGEPLTFAQAGIRNVVRIVDFLPYGYGVGLVVLFVNGKGKRLGDLAAGTVVVKDSDAVALWQLPGAQPAPAAPGAPTPPPIPTYAPATPGEMALRRLDPELRRFVSAYARRRPELPMELRAQLAYQMQPSLRVAAPDVFAQQGPLAALDHLADLEKQ
jgi:uncharacterized RDD family membrane protein YckC